MSSLHGQRAALGRDKFSPDGAGGSSARSFGCCAAGSCSRGLLACLCTHCGSIGVQEAARRAPRQDPQDSGGKQRALALIHHAVETLLWD